MSGIGICTNYFLKVNYWEDLDFPAIPVTRVSNGYAEVQV